MDKEQLMAGILELGGKLAVKYDPNDAGGDQEFLWMRHHCDDPALLPLLDKLSVTMLHVLQAIGKLGPVNGITISKEFRVSKGGVSKITRRLMALGLIEKSTRPDNNKEIYFHLTPLGEGLFALHERLHEQMNRGLLEFLSRYDETELGVVRRLLGDLLARPRLVLEPGKRSD